MQAFLYSVQMRNVCVWALVFQCPVTRVPGHVGGIVHTVYGTRKPSDMILWHWQCSSVSWLPCFLDPMPPVLSLVNDNHLIKSDNQYQQHTFVTLSLLLSYDTQRTLESLEIM